MVAWLGHAEPSRANADDCLSLGSLGRVESGRSIVEGNHFADVRPQPTIPETLNDLTQLHSIGYDNEVDNQATRGAHVGGAGNAYQRSSSANEPSRPLPDVAAVRMALGAQRASVYQLIMKQSGRLVAGGAIAGLLASVLCATFMRKLLFGVRAWDIPTLVGVAVLLGLAALLATFLPAHRAATVNPVEALRAE